MKEKTIRKAIAQPTFIYEHENSKPLKIKILS